VQLRVGAFNAFNTVRFNQPGNQIGSPTFGQITSAEDGRIVQLGIEYQFYDGNVILDTARGRVRRERTRSSL
jgi:hypothetical protein